MINNNNITTMISINSESAIQENNVSYCRNGCGRRPIVRVKDCEDDTDDEKISPSQRTSDSSGDKEVQGFVPTTRYIVSQSSAFKEKSVGEEEMKEQRALLFNIDALQETTTSYADACKDYAIQCSVRCQFHTKLLRQVASDIETGATVASCGQSTCNNVKNTYDVKRQVIKSLQDLNTQLTSTSSAFSNCLGLDTTKTLKSKFKRVRDEVRGQIKLLKKGGNMDCSFDKLKGHLANVIRVTRNVTKFADIVAETVCSHTLLKCGRVHAGTIITENIEEIKSNKKSEFKCLVVVKDEVKEMLHLLVEPMIKTIIDRQMNGTIREQVAMCGTASNDRIIAKLLVAGIKTIPGMDMCSAPKRFEKLQTFTTQIYNSIEKTIKDIVSKICDEADIQAGYNDEQNSEYRDISLNLRVLTAENVLVRSELQYTSKIFDENKKTTDEQERLKRVVANIDQEIYMLNEVSTQNESDCECQMGGAGESIREKQKKVNDKLFSLALYRNYFGIKLFENECTLLHNTPSIRLCNANRNTRVAITKKLRNKTNIILNLKLNTYLTVKAGCGNIGYTFDNELSGFDNKLKKGLKNLITDVSNKFVDVPSEKGMVLFNVKNNRDVSWGNICRRTACDREIANCIKIEIPDGETKDGDPDSAPSVGPSRDGPIDFNRQDDVFRRSVG